MSLDTYLCDVKSFFSVTKSNTNPTQNYLLNFLATRPVLIGAAIFSSILLFLNIPGKFPDPPERSPGAGLRSGLNTDLFVKKLPAAGKCSWPGYPAFPSHVFRYRHI